MRLLETKNVAKFADEIVPTLEDWQAVRSTASIAKDDPIGPAFQKQLGRDRRSVEASAQRTLEKAKALGLGPAQVKFKVKEISAKHIGESQVPGFGPLSWVPEAEVVLVGEPQSAEGEKLRGEYRLALGSMRGGLKLPRGWRFSDGVRWKSFPPGVADRKTESELNILNKVYAEHRLSLVDDPALEVLANMVTRLLREIDPDSMARGTVRSMDEIWAAFEEKSAELNRPLPPKNEFEEAFSLHHEQTMQSIRAMLDQRERLGLDFTNADFRLKEAVVENVYVRGEFGELAEVTCETLRLIFDIHSDVTTKAGRPLSGEYTIAVARAQRDSDRWTIEGKIRWQQFPQGLISEEDKAEFEFENYVAEHGALPPGTKAPEVEFVRLDDGSRVRSAEFLGKILVLEFWATTCGPCQEPLAKLQTFREKHPDWKDRVEVVTVSIDESPKQARQHLEKRGWTNTVSLWAGDGNWYAPVAKQFRLRGIPTAYVIDAGGKVAWAGHPFGDQIQQSVTDLLK